MRRVVLLDCETDGIEETATCIEVAVVLYSLPHASPVRSYASLIRASGNAAESCNGIPPGALLDAPPAERVWGAVKRFAADADAFVCHNAAFDSRFITPDVSHGKPFICSMDDLQWPRAERPGEGLVKLALAHGLGVAAAHRALTDCDLLARLLTRVHEMGVDLEPFLARGLRPKATFQAIVPYERKDDAKAAGFKWNAETRMWTRRMAIEDTASLPFRVARVSRRDGEPGDAPEHTI